LSSWEEHLRNKNVVHAGTDERRIDFGDIQILFAVLQ
jgi:hypothetical protein